MAVKQIVKDITLRREEIVEKEQSEELPPFGTPEQEAEDERLWQEKFDSSTDLLASMAGKAREQRRQGKTFPLETIIDG